jgi:hypothetical protein
VVLMAGEDDEDERTWTWIRTRAGERAGMSTAQAKAILEAHGYTSVDHTGIEEAIEVVMWATAPGRGP